MIYKILAVSDPVLIALIGNLAAIVISIIVSIGNRKRLNEVHKSTNGLKDELVATARDSAFQEGVAYQKQQQKEP